MKKNELLSRDEFRESVMERDGWKCVFCGEKAKDAHHIMERRLWGDGGYYLDNGASVCEEHHKACERTQISTQEVRQACGIEKIVLPEHLYGDQEYDKWGNPVLATGQRLKGELFFDESVQKVLAEGGVLDLFSDRVKYPRTHHVPWSKGIHDDDRVLKDMKAWEGQRVIVTEKMDGENTTLYADGMHARSVESKNHPSRTWVKQWRASWGHEIPEGWRVCGENLYAKHSIAYEELESYFLGFSVWNEKNECLSWDETVQWFELLGVPKVKVLYDGIYNEKIIRELWSEKQWGVSEGYVIRWAEKFNQAQFRTKVGKFVRQGHVQTIKHWMHGQPVEPNRLKTK